MAPQHTLGHATEHMQRAVYRTQSRQRYSTRSAHDRDVLTQLTWPPSGCFDDDLGVSALAQHVVPERLVTKDHGACRTGHDGCRGYGRSDTVSHRRI
jgi:hypothetical protein